MFLKARGVPANKILKIGGVLANKFLKAGGVPANKFLKAGGVPANNLFHFFYTFIISNKVPLKLKNNVSLLGRGYLPGPLRLLRTYLPGPFWQKTTHLQESFDKEQLFCRALEGKHCGLDSINI